MSRIVLTLIGPAMTVAAVVAVVSGNSTPPRAPERAHYARLAALDPAAAPARASLDALTFSLDRWGDLYNWRLVKPHYVTVPLDTFTAVKPPANSSPQTRAELDYLLGLQKNRTEQEHEWCLKLAEIYHHPLLSNPVDPRYRPNRDNLFFVGRDLGPWFRQDNLPKTTELLARVYRDAMVYIVELKLRYARPRPHHLEPRIKADDKTIPHASFPSGHSFASYINAGVLSRLAPTRRSDLLAKAHELAWSRELLGVHYPSDTEAGRVLAEDFVRFLFENADFVREFQGVQREWQERSVTNH
jgi:acid phosphatase (class A)